MNRRGFIRIGSMFAFAQITNMSTLSALKKLNDDFPDTDTMPVMFVGHGNPMNAILDNDFHRTWQLVGKSLPRPKAILSISVHWLTSKTSVTAMKNPKTIYDFGGFPKKLFEQKYPANGTPEFAKFTKELIDFTNVELDDTWGLDHGTWSVLLPMFPLADIPVFQLSIVYQNTLEFHYEIGKQLRKLRNKGVLILGSGNLVHNLAKVDWQGSNNVYDWALEFDAKFTTWLNNDDKTSILNYKKLLGNVADMAHPSNEHLLPLIYILGTKNNNDKITYFNDKFDMASISMKSFMYSS